MSYITTLLHEDMASPPEEYSPSGDAKSLEIMKKSITIFDNTMAEGTSAKKNQKSLKKNLDESRSEKSALEKELKDLESQISKVKGRINSNESKEGRLLIDIDQAEQDFSTLRERYERVASEKRDSQYQYHQTIAVKKPSFTSKINAKEIPNTLLNGDGTEVECFALGDIHGWAPGFLAFLMQNELAEVKINGEICNSDSELSRFFPHPRNWEEQGLFIEGPWLDNSPFTPPKELGDIRGRISSISIIPTEKLLERSFILQVGDLADRGDYSELSFEIARQLVVKSGGRVIVLMGNHEGFLIERNFTGWWKNEEKKNFDPKQANFVGCQRYPDVTGWNGDWKGMTDQEKQGALSKSVFNSYSAHLAHLLLSQEFILRRIMDKPSKSRLISLTQPSLDLAGINDKDLSDIATGRGWDKVKLSLRWLESVWNSDSPMVVPGAPCLFSMGHVLGLHSESVGLIEMSPTDWKSFIDPFFTDSGAQLRLSLYKTRGKKDGKRGMKGITDSLLWSRDAGTRWGIGEISKDLEKTATLVNSKIPSVSQIYHGHTPQMKVISLQVPTGLRTIRVTNLDWSFTPPYIAEGRHPGDPYSMDREVEFDSISTLMVEPREYRPEGLDSRIRSVPVFQGTGEDGKVSMKYSVKSRRNTTEICSFRFSDNDKITVKPISRPRNPFGFAKLLDGGDVYFSNQEEMEIDISASEALLIIELHRGKWRVTGSTPARFVPLCLFQNLSASHGESEIITAVEKWFAKTFNQPSKVSLPTPPPTPPPTPVRRRPPPPSTPPTSSPPNPPPKENDDVQSFLTKDPDGEWVPSRVVAEVEPEKHLPDTDEARRTLKDADFQEFETFDDVDASEETPKEGG